MEELPHELQLASIVCRHVAIVLTPQQDFLRPRMTSAVIRVWAGINKIRRQEKAHSSSAASVWAACIDRAGSQQCAGKHAHSQCRTSSMQGLHALDASPPWKCHTMMHQCLPASTTGCACEDLRLWHEWLAHQCHVHNAA